MITIKNTQRTYLVKKTALHKTIKKMLASIGLGDFDVSVWITSDQTIRKFNKQFRNKDRPTDILSFPFHDEPITSDNAIFILEEEKNLGDIIIAAPYAARQAAHIWHRSFDQHMTALLAHGIAHLIGHEHNTDAEFKKMQHIEEKLIAAAIKKTKPKGKKHGKN